MKSDKSDHGLWQRMQSRPLHDYKIFRSIEQINKDPEGREASYVVLDAPEWATVVPLVNIEGREHFVMVRQYRHGANEVCMEFPGGVANLGEPPIAAAARELEEETGYIPGTIEEIGCVWPNPAFMSNRFYVFVARDLHHTGITSLDDSEYLDCILEPVDHVKSVMGSAPYSHALMVVALYFYNQWEAKHQAR